MNLIGGGLALRNDIGLGADRKHSVTRRSVPIPWRRRSLVSERGGFVFPGMQLNNAVDFGQGKDDLARSAPNAEENLGPDETLAGI